MPPSIVIKQDRDKPIRNQHPWIFSGAIESVRGNPTPGEIVSVLSHKGDFLARGYWNEKSQIQVRILTWQDEAIDEDWWRRMLKRAIDARGNDDSCRLINAENDYLPGLIVDRYADWLVLQALTLHIDQQKGLIARLLRDIFAERGETLTGIYERSDVEVRRKEGLQEEKNLLWGEHAPDEVTIQEGAARFLVDIQRGHKTGFYLDQQPNRLLISELAQGKTLSLLNLFSYTGGFGVHALDAGAAHVVNVDSSREALELAEENVKLNNLPEERAEFIQADVFDYLRDIAAEGQQFDVVVCDPPKFAQNAQQVDKAARGYKDLNLNAFKVIKPGGYLMTFSCSGAISPDLFQKIVFGALADSGRQAQIIRHLGAGEDHPIALTFPEGEYLKGLLLRVY
ncbi:MAG: class I SAM-dependent rRNA methyltransferase [Chloroflexota bacterium]